MKSWRCAILWLDVVSSAPQTVLFSCVGLLVSLLLSFGLSSAAFSSAALASPKTKIFNFSSRCRRKLLRRWGIWARKWTPRRSDLKYTTIIWTRIKSAALEVGLKSLEQPSFSSGMGPMKTTEKTRSGLISSKIWRPSQIFLPSSTKLTGESRRSLTLNDSLLLPF